MTLFVLFLEVFDLRSPEHVEDRVLAAINLPKCLLDFVLVGFVAKRHLVDVVVQLHFVQVGFVFGPEPHQGLVLALQAEYNIGCHLTHLDCAADPTHVGLGHKVLEKHVDLLLALGKKSIEGASLGCG